MQRRQGGDPLRVRFGRGARGGEEDQLHGVAAGVQRRVGRPARALPRTVADRLRQIAEIPAGDALALPAAARLGRDRGGARGHGVQDRGAAPRGQLAPVGRRDGDSHLQVVRQTVDRPGRGRDVHPEAPVDEFGERREKGARLPRHVAQDGVHGLVQRDQPPAQRLGKPPEQSLHLRAQQPRHQPVDGLGRHLRGVRERDPQRDPVFRSARVEPVLQGQRLAPGLEGPREEGELRVVRPQGGHVGLRHAQEPVPAAGLDQVRERAHVAHPGQPAAVEGREVLVGDAQVPAPQPVLHGLDPGDRLPVVAQKGEGAAGLVLHERGAHEDVGGLLRPDRPVGDRTPRDDREPEKSDLLGRHHLAAPGVPARIAVGRPAQPAGQRLQPDRIDGRRRACEQARGLHHLGRDDPGAGRVEEPRAGEDHDLAVLRRAEEVLLLFDRDVREEPAQDRTVDAAEVRGRGRGIGPPGAQAALGQDLGDLAVDVLPLAHALEREEVPAAEAPRGPGARLAAPGFLEALPQGEQGQKVRVRLAESGVGPVGLGRALGRTLARVRQAQRRGDDAHLAQAALPPRLDQHARQTGVERDARHQAPGLGELDPGRPAPPPAGRAVARPLGDGPELDQQPEPVGDAPGLGPVDEGELRRVAEVERDHAQDDLGQVGAQDLGGGELGPAAIVLLRVEPDAQPRGRAAAAALALIGAAARDGHDRHGGRPCARGVARDAGEARVHDRGDARDGD